jgi:hypothetical protein
VIVAVLHGLVENLNGKHATTVILEDNEVPDFNSMFAGETPPTITEEYLPLAIELHLH